jgi:hypothetical protein
LAWLGGPRIVSLAFVQIYLACRLVSVSNYILGVHTKLFPFIIDETTAISGDARKEIESILTHMSHEVGELGLPMTKLSVDRFRSSIAIDTCEKAEANFDEMQQRFQDEILGIRFLFLEPNKMSWLNQEDPFGKEVSGRFPSAHYEVQEAANCFALNRHTATVMHCMRVLEFGLDALGFSLKVKRSTKGWGRDLNNFSDKWDQIEKGWKKGDPALGWRRKFYPSVFAEFRYFENAWRNHAMHAHARYGEEESLRVFQHVRTFMQLISERLREPRKKRTKSAPKA